MTLSQKPWRLHDVAHAMHALLRGDVEPAVIAQQFGAPVERVAAYQRFVAHHVYSVLAKHYTVLVDALPAEIWTLLIERYFREYPAQHYELNACAQGFVDYLAALAQTQQWGITECHAEIAALEWQEWEVYKTLDDIPLAHQCTVPILNPTLVVMQFNYPVGTFVCDWRAYRRRGDGGEKPAWPTQPESETVFVFRHPQSLLHAFCVAEPELLCAFKIVHDGMTWEQAACETGWPIERLYKLRDDAAQRGIIVLPAKRGME